MHYLIKAGLIYLLFGVIFLNSAYYSRLVFFELAFENEKFNNSFARVFFL